MASITAHLIKECIAPKARRMPALVDCLCNALWELWVKLAPRSGWHVELIFIYFLCRFSCIFERV